MRAQEGQPGIDLILRAKRGAQVHQDVVDLLSQVFWRYCVRTTVQIGAITTLVLLKEITGIAIFAWGMNMDDLLEKLAEFRAKMLPASAGDFTPNRRIICLQIEPIFRVVGRGGITCNLLKIMFDKDIEVLAFADARQPKRERVNDEIGPGLIGDCVEQIAPIIRIKSGIAEPGSADADPPLKLRSAGKALFENRIPQGDRAGEHRIQVIELPILGQNGR
jgi:hypothetical protein